VRSAFVGRDAEIAAVAGELEEAWAGRARVVLCRGEPGIGKTRLAEELSELARERGAEVAWGVGIESAGAPPYWPWTQVLRAVSGWCDLGAVAAEHDLTVDLARLAPDVFDAAGHAGPGGWAEYRFGQFDAVARLLCLVHTVPHRGRPMGHGGGPGPRSSADAQPTQRDCPGSRDIMGRSSAPHREKEASCDAAGRSTFTDPHRR
jgi:hypothetical protein